MAGEISPLDRTGRHVGIGSSLNGVPVESNETPTQVTATAAVQVQRPRSVSDFDNRLGPLTISSDVNIRPNKPGEWHRVGSPVGYGFTNQRIPLLMTTEVMAQQNRYIAFWCSPESVQWTLRMRGALQEARGGMIQHYWKDNRRNTFFDEPSISFTFQSGNIMPVRVEGVGDNRTEVSLPHGLLNLYEFLELLDQPKVMDDGRTNFIYILYSSLAFPKIVLRGFFTPDEGTNFSEGAQDNAEMKWTGTFRVAGSYPSFNSADSLARTWSQVQDNLGFDVVYTPSAFTTAVFDKTPSGTGR